MSSRPEKLGTYCRIEHLLSQRIINAHLGQCLDLISFPIQYEYN